MADITDETLPTPEEVTEVLKSDDDILKDLTPDEAKVAAKILIPLAAKANRLAEAKKGKELEKLAQDLIGQNKEMMQKELDKFRKANEPLSQEEISKLISQEYIEFPLKIGRGSLVREFVIRELPIATEKKVLKTLQRTVFGTLLKEISALDWSSEGVTGLGRVAKVIDMVPGAIDALADICAICLDPDGDWKIDAVWVQNNLSVDRMYTILNAQATANRWRDFFSRVYQAIPQQMIG